ncbi:MAG: HD-GYP domain-containing protein, partial [Omnitrophica WOR_2 bacterium]
MKNETAATAVAPERTGEQVVRSRYVFVYTTFFSLAGFLLIVTACFQLPSNLRELAFFVGMAVLAEILGVELFTGTRGSRVSVAGVIAIASILMFGPAAGVITNMFCGVTASISNLFHKGGQVQNGRATWIQRTAFNIGMLVVSTASAGWVFILSGGSVGNTAIWSNAVPILLAVVTNELVNLLILLGVLYIQTGKSPYQIWNQNFRWAFPIGILGGIIGGSGLAIAYQMANIAGLAVFFLPVLSVSYSFRLYVANTKDYVNQLEAINRTLDETNLGLLETFGAIIDTYDIYTYGHSAQVAVYAGALAEKMNLPEAERLMLVKAALVHDIGKIGVQDSITSKKGPLTPEELSIMHRHPILSADIIRRMKGLQQLVPLVRHHHERWNGSGYPAGLAGEEIPFGARILALADALDAMCSDRPYHPTMTLEQVTEEVNRCSGTHFDPHVVTAFNLVAKEKGKEFFKNSAASVDKTV